MARYQLAVRGVIDHDHGDAIILANFPGWSEYETWLNAGNVPDPMPDASDPTLAERRLRAARNAEEFMRLAWIAGTVDVGGAQYRFDRFDYSVLLAVDAAGGPWPMFQWRDVAGAMHALNPAQRNLLVNAVARRLYALLTKCWQIQADIEASNNPESINTDDYGGI